MFFEFPIAQMHTPCRKVPYKAMLVADDNHGLREFA